MRRIEAGTRLTESDCRSPLSVCVSIKHYTMKRNMSGKDLNKPGRMEDKPAMSATQAPSRQRRVSLSIALMSVVSCCLV